MIAAGKIIFDFGSMGASGFQNSYPSTPCVDEAPMHAKETPLQKLEQAEQSACSRYYRLMHTFMSDDVIEYAKRLCDDAKAALNRFFTGSKSGSETRWR